jgi:hypothetical protein
MSREGEKVIFFRKIHPENGGGSVVAKRARAG